MAENPGNTFLAGWKQLDDTSKNKLLQTLQDDLQFQSQPQAPLQITDEAFKKGAADIFSIETEAHHIYSDIQLYPYCSSLYYYPTIQWSLDKTPDTDDYWVGLYDKNEKDNKKYLAYQWIHKAAQGSYKVGKLKTTASKYGSDRLEEYEARIFKHGYQRLNAQSNILRGIVNHLPTAPFTQSTEKLLTGQKKGQSDKELESFLVGIQRDTTTTCNFSSNEDAVKKWNGCTPNEKYLMFPILEQDTLPDVVKKADDRGTDRLEPNLHFDDHNKLGSSKKLHSKPGVVDDCSDVPSQIVLTIALDYSYAYVYPEIDVEYGVPSEGAWLGMYHIHG